MKNEPLSTLIHYDYFYENADIDTIQKGINEAVFEKKYDIEYVYEAVIRNASRHNRIDILEFVFAKDDFDLSEKTLNEILNQSFMCRMFQSSEFLMRKGAKLNLDDSSIIWVLPHCSLEIINTILECGHDIYNPKYNLLYLSFKEYPARYDIMENMFSLGAKLEDIRYDYLYNILLMFDHEESNKKIDYIISRGYDINKEDCTLIKWATGKQYNLILEHLILCGANLYPKDGSLFKHCSRNKNTETLKFLIEKGLILDSKDDSIIKEAAEMDNLVIVQDLVQRGFNIDVAKNFGYSDVKNWATEKIHNELNGLLEVNPVINKKNKL